MATAEECRSHPSHPALPQAGLKSRAGHNALRGWVWAASTVQPLLGKRGVEGKLARWLAWH